MSNAFNNAIKLAKAVSVTDFGAVGNGSTDDTTAIQAAIDAVGAAGGGALVFPAGLYKTTATLTVDKDLIYFKGAGTRSSAIWAFHDDGPAVLCEHATSPGTSYLNGFGISDMMIRARMMTTADAALVLNKVQLVNLQNVGLEDHFGGLKVLGGNNHYIENLNIYSPRSTAPIAWGGDQAGSFFYKVGESSDGQTPFEIFVNNFNFRWADGGVSIENGIEVNAVDGLWLSNGHIMGCSNADMIVRPIAGDEQITGIRLDNVWFDNNSANGLIVSGTTSSQFGVIELSASRFLTPTAHAIFVDASATAFAGLVINGGVIHKPAFFGILLRAGLQHIISGVEFAACNTSATANTGGVSVQSGVDNVLVMGCQFTQTQGGVTAASMQGVRIGPDATSQVTVIGCNFNLDSGASDISDASTSDLNKFAGNTTTKSPNITSVTGTVLDIPEIGEVFYVSNGLNFDNMAGRWGGRRVTLVFAGICTVTHGSGGIRLSGGSNFVSANGDTLTLVYLTSINDWIEVGRMVA